MAGGGVWPPGWEQAASGFGLWFAWFGDLCCTLEAKLGSPMPNGIEHGGGQPAGEGVLLAGVI